MAKPPRDTSPVGTNTYFITASAWNGQPLFQSERICKLFLATLFQYRDQKKFAVHEFVLMLNHFHLLMTTGPDITLERAMQLIKGGFSHRAGKELGMKGEI